VVSPVSYRLPRTVNPERYVIELTPDLEAATFDGLISIDLRVDEAVDEIVLNAAELDIVTAELTTSGGRTMAATVGVDAELERATLQFGQPVPAGPASVTMRFTGILNDQLHGFYRSTFVDAEGLTQVIATTQFESTDARRAFPCWDEPDFKATFALTLVVPDHLTALSSGAEHRVEVLPGGTRRVEFAETMRMSTYVLAWVVGPFELTAPVDVDGVPLRLAAPVGRAALTPFGIECGSHALRYLSSYFGIPYPSDKIDHVAIPDFAFGAMENLGCVTYRESALLADTDRASKLELMHVAQVVAHETAHMWFGDLVTMKWWNGIWLNEAFATFMELKTTDDFRPDWQAWTAFGSGRAAALVTDGLHATRSIEIEVGAPEEAEAMFDVLTYQKGGSVLRMLEQYLGEETFRRGIGRYLQRHHHANTETSDLWDALEAESGEPVRATMDSWIFQGGHPLVSVGETDGGDGIVLSQRRFLYRGESDEKWTVPVNLRASVAGTVVERRLLLSDTVRVDLGGPIDWVVVNEGGWGFYRVRYTPDLLDRLAAAGLQKICTPLERVGLIGDTWAAVLSGATELSTWLALIRAVGDETDPDVWSALLGPLGLLDLIVTDADRPALARAVRLMAGPAFEHLGWTPVPGEGERAGILRSRLIATLGGIGAAEEIRTEATARLACFDSDPGAIAADILTATVSVVAAAGGEAAYEALLERYRQADTPQDQVRYLAALGGVPDRAQLARSLDLALSPEVRSQDGPNLIAGILMNRNGADLAWSWIEEHWTEIVARFPRNLLIRVLDGSVALTDAALVARIHRFIASADLPGRGLRLRQLEERMDINVAFADRVRPGLAAALVTL
jgi:puromycin-sensitive aminopeptidase